MDLRLLPVCPDLKIEVTEEEEWYLIAGDINSVCPKMIVLACNNNTICDAGI